MRDEYLEIWIDLYRQGHQAREADRRRRWMTVGLLVVLVWSGIGIVWEMFAPQDDSVLISSPAAITCDGDDRCRLGPGKSDPGRSGLWMDPKKAMHGERWIIGHHAYDPRDLFGRRV